MPFTDQAIRTEIQEWINKDGSEVGRITTDTPLALNKDLLEVVWAGIQGMAAKPTIIYVCNTMLEAKLLDRRLKDPSFHGGEIGAQSSVCEARPVILKSYAQFREILDSETTRRQTSFPARLVVICEQEPGSNMDAVVARGHLALLVRNHLIGQPDCNVKLIGLSFRRGGGGDWLKHPAKVMTSNGLGLSLDHSIHDPAGTQEVNGSRHPKDDKRIARTVKKAGAALKRGETVVVYGSIDESVEFGGRVEEELGQEVEYFDRLATGIPKDVELDGDIGALFRPEVAGPLNGLVLIEPGTFATALPIANVGMVVSIVTKLSRREYNDKLHLVTYSRSTQSLRSLYSQRWTGQVRDALGSAEMTPFVEIMGLDDGEQLSRKYSQIQDGTDDPLRECFNMVALYPGTAFNLLPVFGAVDEPWDLAVRLRSMDLVESHDHGRGQASGFVLTKRGRVVELLMGNGEVSLTLETATALSGTVMSRQSTKVARSILRLSFIKEMSGSFVQECPMELQDDDAFMSFMRSIPQDAVQGGPGKYSASRGLVWLIWTAFEVVSHQVDVLGLDLPQTVVPGENWPFFLRMGHLKEAMNKLEAWESLVGLGPIQEAERDGWNMPLTPAEMVTVDREIARANYSTILTIPQRQDGQQEDFQAIWLRTNEPAEIRGEFDRYLHTIRREGTLFGCLPTSIFTHEDGHATVDGLMLFDYGVSLELIGDPEAEEVDPWVRAVAMQDK